jgi:Cation efflux family
VLLTAAMMIAEIIGGALFGSMALMADGWHMATHAAALGVAALAYRFARTHAHDPRFAFGTSSRCITALRISIPGEASGANRKYPNPSQGSADQKHRKRDEEADGRAIAERETPRSWPQPTTIRPVLSQDHAGMSSKQKRQSMIPGPQRRGRPNCWYS